MQATYVKFLAIACAAAVLSGYQLLHKNSDKGNAAVVVSPTASHDALRSADLRTDSVTKISHGFSTNIAHEVETRAIKTILAADSALATTTPQSGMVPQNGIQPIKGSESILFSNMTNRLLGGCSTLGVIELHHTGSYEDALIVLRNETYRMNSNWLVPIKASKTSPNRGDSHEIMIKAQMMRCPFKLASSN